MAKFTVVKYVDAYYVYEGDVEAESAEAASKYAYDHEDKVDWTSPDVLEFDARKFLTLDEDGEEIEETQQGDVI